MKYILFFLLSCALFANEVIQPIPHTVKYDAQKAKLGKKLFFETALSRDDSVACVSCHDIYNGGADSRKVSVGYNGRKGNIQSPTVLNAVFNIRQFWNGRAKTLKEQAAGPLNNPVEHNMTPELVEKKLKELPQYVKEFQQVYKDTITFDHVIDAIAEFEKTLITPDAKFDKYLRKELTLTQQEKKGYTLFKQYGCISCHNGKNLGGNSFAKMGIFEAYSWDGTYPDRYALTHKEADKNVFKVPTLRNIALTAPYMHDASAKTLQEAIQSMAQFNLGLELSKKDIDAIASFLQTLTGQLPKSAYD
jgi:cytochrome c peroxidase